MTWVWMDSTWKRQGDKAMAVIYARNLETRTTKTFGFTDIKPYFYASDEEGDLLSCYGDKISKVVVDLPNEVGKEKSLFPVTTKFFESDIPYDIRYVIDKGISYAFDDEGNPVDIGEQLIEPRTCFFDIECLIPQGIKFDDTIAKKAEYPINVISIYDNYTDDTIILTAGMERIAKDQLNFDTEKELLEAFANVVKRADYDILTGWNSEGFDIPYILGRADQLKANISGLSRMRFSVPNMWKFTGRQRMDLMEYFKHWSKPMGRMPYDLKSVAKIAGYEYQDFGASIVDLTNNKEWETIIEYARHDVIALKMINQKFGLIQFYESLRKTIGCKITDVGPFRTTRPIEYFLMRMGIKPMPDKTVHTKVDYEGAFVVAPPVGLHEMVAAVDLSAMYPNIMMAYNMSPDIDKVIPTALKVMMDRREELRAKRLAGDHSEVLAVSEQSVKYIANSFYGYLGSVYARLYSPKLAEKVTATGREMGYAIDRLLKSIGYIVYYGDTDSRFFGPVKSVEEGLDVERAINEFLITWAEDLEMDVAYAPSIKLEKIYKTVLFKKKNNSMEAAKKNYAGHLIWKDGEVKNELSFTGVGAKRSDNAMVSRHLMEDFFNLVLIDNDPTAAVRLVKSEYEKVKRGLINVHDVAIPRETRSEKEDRWKEGKYNGERVLGIRFDSSMKPKLLYCIRPFENICIDNDVDDQFVKDTIQIDWNTMAEKTVKNKMKSFVESIGKSWDDAVFGQMSLADMMTLQNP